MSELGHNSADDRLRLLIERIERLEQEKKVVGEDIKDVYTEAKAVGYDAKIIREIIRLRKKDDESLQEWSAVLRTYASALGMDLL